MENVMLPEELSSFVGSEYRDFEVKAGRAKPLAASLATIIFGLIWTGLTFVFVSSFLGPLFLDGKIILNPGELPTFVGVNGFSSFILPAIIFGIFIFVGIGRLLWGFYSLFQKGGYFVGTSTRLIYFYKGKVRSIDWGQFSGDIEISGNDQKGSVSLKLRTGTVLNRKYTTNRSRYIADTIYIVDIPNVSEVEQICRKRIKENVPTSNGAA